MFVDFTWKLNEALPVDHVFLSLISTLLFTLFADFFQIVAGCHGVFQHGQVNDS